MNTARALVVSPLEFCSLGLLIWIIAPKSLMQRLSLSYGAAAVQRKRNRFLPWIIGLVIIAIADGYLLFFLTDEGAAELSQQAALIVIPIVYLVLMFLTFKSQE